MASEVVPAGGGTVAPANPGGAVVPVLPQHLGGVQPYAGNAVSREHGRRGGGNVPMNLAAHSNLDEIVMEMTLLNGELTILNATLAELKALSEALDAIIANMDELGKLYEAPATTRSALDADSTVAALIDELTALTQRHGHAAQVFNAEGFIALTTVRNVQDNERAMGAGPRLLASAGRL